MSEVIAATLPVTQENMFYFYKAVIGRPNKPELPAITDADTFHLAEFDYGREQFEKNVSVRLCWPNGTFIDAWETRRRPRNLTDEEWEGHKEKGKLATEFVRNLLPDGQKVVLVTNRDEDGTFRDLVAAVFIPKEDGTYIDLGKSLEANGHLKSEDGKP